MATSGDADPGVLLAGGGVVDAISADFIAAIAKHRHPQRLLQGPCQFIATRLRPGGRALSGSCNPDAQRDGLVRVRR